MGMYRPTKEEIIINTYKRDGIKEVLNLAIKEYKIRNLHEIEEILNDIAEFSKIPDFKVEEYKNDLFDIIQAKINIDRIERVYAPYHPEGKDGELCNELDTKIEIYLDSIEEKFNKQKADVINSLEVKNFVDYIFDKNNWFSYEEIINLIIDYCKNNGLNPKIDDQIYTIINIILKDKDSIETVTVTLEQEKNLRNKINANETIIENYLNSKIKDRDEMLQRNKEEQEKAEFIQSILECYKTKGLREAIITLHTDGCNLEEDFQIFIKELYSQNNIIFVQNAFLIELLKNMKLAQNTTKDIFDSCRGYKGEIPDYLQIKLDKNNTFYNNNLDELVKIINKDFNGKRLYQNEKLPLKEFINLLINKNRYILTREELFSEVSSYCALRGIMLILTDTLNNYLKEVIRNISIKNETEGMDVEPFDLSDDYLKISIDKLIEYIKDSTNQNILDEEEKIYFEINELTEENKELYNQIENLYKRIEANEDKKRELTLKYQNILLKK